MTEHDLSDIVSREAALLELVRAKDGTAGNTTLLRELSWPPDLYWTVRDRLVDSGQLELGRGKGGSVRLVAQQSSESDFDNASVPPGDAVLRPALPSNLEAQTQEGELYGPVAAVLGTDWARDMRFRNHVVEVTARQGRRNTGGTWTRPDIVVAALRVFPHIPGKFFDLITFELKCFDGIDVTAVYEALAHRRAATQAYVWFHVPQSKSNDDALLSDLERVTDEARRHGIGLIVGEAADQYSSWETKLRAVRHEPDPELLNEFIAQQLPTLAKDELAAWFR